MLFRSVIAYVDDKVTNFISSNGLTTLEQVNNAIEAGLVGYATESYVDNAVANVHVDLTGYATTSYVNSSINSLINSAPGTLNTLKELADALNNDPGFAANITNILATKVTANDVNGLISLATTQFATHA